MNNLKLVVIPFILVSIIAGVIITQNDPIEQAKKEQDEKMQANAAEFIQATVLYYSIHAGLPWFTEEDKGTNCFGNSPQLTAIPMNTMQNCIEVFISDSALPKDYLKIAALKSLVVTNPNPQTGEKLDTVVCFQPQSNVWQKDTNTRYNINGTDIPANRCNSQGGSEYCYWCTQ